MNKSFDTSNTIDYRYPWDGLEEDLACRGEHELCLLAYGSLMNVQSASKTIDRDSLQDLSPIIGSGIRRIFNYPMSLAGFQRHGQPSSPQHISALSVKSTGDANDRVNGLLVRVKIEDIGRLRMRESGYDLVAIETAWWSTRQRTGLTVFVLEGGATDGTVLPHLGYLKICADGAKQISPAFHRYFQETTFLADGTKLSQWTPDPPSTFQHP